MFLTPESGSEGSSKPLTTVMRVALVVFALLLVGRGLILEVIYQAGNLTWQRSSTVTETYQIQPGVWNVQIRSNLPPSGYELVATTIAFGENSALDEQSDFSCPPKCHTSATAVVKNCDQRAQSLDVTQRISTREGNDYLDEILIEIDATPVGNSDIRDTTLSVSSSC